MGSRSTTRWFRFGLLVIGGALILGAVWFAASWVDTGSDNTCGSLVRRDHLWTTVPDCRPVMLLRLVAAVLMAVMGAVFVLASSRRRWLVERRSALSVAAVGALASVAALLIVNEIVRSGGRWNH